MGVIKNYLSLVKFSHTIFAMPFACIGFFTAVQTKHISVDYKLFLLVILCMVFARSAAMAFNRYIDRQFDAANARTAIREIPSGIIQPKNALAFVIINALLFIITTYFINRLCFFLSPVALTVVLGYSYTKRFTSLCHLVLGVGLALAPIGAYIAVTGTFALLPIIYSMIVLFWVSGFDIIYALQDEEFDRKEKLNSIPVLLGRKKALLLSRCLHIAAAILVIVSAIIANVALFHWLGVLVFIGLLLYQHTIVKPNDISKVNIAFATTNGIASVLFAFFVLLDLYF